MSAADSQVREVLDAFVSRISHELRTPLAVVVGYAELLEARDDPATRNEAVVRIRQAAERLSSVIDDILAATALEAGAIDLELEPLELQGALTDAIEAYESRGGGCRFSVSLRGAEWPVVWADPEQLESILGYLLWHACRQASECGPTSVVVERRGDCAFVSVTDHGRGLSESQRAQLVERFAHAEPGDRPVGDSGLGLYIVRRLVELHGGSVALGSAEGGGTTVTVTLPLAAQDVR